MRTSIYIRVCLPKLPPFDLNVTDISGKTTLGELRTRLAEVAKTHENKQVRAFVKTWGPRGRLSSNPGYGDDSKTLSKCFGPVWRRKHGNTLLSLLDTNVPPGDEVPSGDDDANASSTSPSKPQKCLMECGFHAGGSNGLCSQCTKLYNAMPQDTRPDLEAARQKLYPVASSAETNTKEHPQTSSSDNHGGKREKKKARVDHRSS
eukprot:m.269003 g.269003  ORF g.269003 m.269003 type:complete len:205 (+) comp81683_c0_seq1:150-764(+)